MRQYEVTVVLGEKSTAAKKKSVSAKIKEIAGALGGEIVKTEDWGKRDLAYTIEDSNSGFFLFFLLELEAQGARQLDDKLRMEEDLIRYLVVRKEK